MDDPTTCGDPRYELSCENNKTVLTLFSGKYYVQEINYLDYTIRLVDPGIKETDCSSIPKYSLAKYNFTISSYNSYDVDRYPLDSPFEYGYIIYLNCSKPVKDDPGYVDTAHCINRDSKSYLYAFAATYNMEDYSFNDLYNPEGDSFNYFSIGDLKDYGHVKVVAMIALSGFDGNRVREDVPNRPLAYEQIYAMLLYGFRLSWLKVACSHTCGDNQQCRFNETTRDLECDIPYCDYRLGIEVAKSCDMLSKKLILVEDVLLGLVKGIVQIFGITKSSELSNELSDYKIGIEIGRVTGRYILPFYVTRFVVGLIIFFMLLIYTYRRRHISMYANIEVFLQGSTLMPIRYSYKEIKNMARNFKDKLGEGGFGAVYKGKLRSGPFVAIKMLGSFILMTLALSL